jgi:hypothetical protein
MNAPVFDRSRIREQLSDVGARWGLTISGVLPSGCLSHASNHEPVVFLADKLRDDVSVLDVASAEVELDDRLSFASRIVLRSELAGSPRGSELLAAVRNL